MRHPITLIFLPSTCRTYNPIDYHTLEQDLLHVSTGFFESHHMTRDAKLLVSYKFGLHTLSLQRRYEVIGLYPFRLIPFRLTKGAGVSFRLIFF